MNSHSCAQNCYLWWDKAAPHPRCNIAHSWLLKMVLQYLYINNSSLMLWLQGFKGWNRKAPALPYCPLPPKKCYSKGYSFWMRSYPIAITADSHWEIFFSANLSNPLLKLSKPVVVVTEACGSEFHKWIRHCARKSFFSFFLLPINSSGWLISQISWVGGKGNFPHTVRKFVFLYINLCRER